MEALIIYCLAVWSVFFFLNYAAITARPAAWLKRVLGPKLGYPLSCAFCWCGWVSIAFWAVGWMSTLAMMAAPVVHLFLDLTYCKLGGGVQK